MLALTLFGIFFAIALAGVPLLYSILITTVGVIAWQGLGHPMETIFLSFIGGVEPFILLAVPLFIFAGELLAQGGVGPVSYTHLDVYKRQVEYLPAARPLENAVLDY